MLNWANFDSKIECENVLKELENFYDNYITDNRDNPLSYDDLSKLAVLSAPKTAWNPRMFELNDIHIDNIHLLETRDEKPIGAELIRFVKKDDLSAPAFFVWALKKGKLNEN